MGPVKSFKTLPLPENEKIEIYFSNSATPDQRRRCIRSNCNGVEFGNVVRGFDGNYIFIVCSKCGFEQVTSSTSFYRVID